MSRERRNVEDMDNNDEFTLYDNYGHVLIFNGNEDFAIHLAAFKARMQVLGHEGVTAVNDDLVPLRPDDAYARLNGLLGWGDQADNNDDRRVDKYKTEMRYWNKSTAFVMWSWLKTMGPKVIQTMDGIIPNLRLATRENWLAVVGATRAHYGGYNPTKGDLNYLAMKSVPDFTDAATTHKGLLTIKLLKEERDRFADEAAGVYNDTFYIPWLTEHMGKWDKLAQLRYRFSRNTVNQLTYAEMRVELLDELKIIEEEDNRMGSKLQDVYMKRMLGQDAVHPKQSMDSIDFTGNASMMAELQNLRVQVAEMRTEQLRQPSQQQQQAYQFGKPSSRSYRRSGGQQSRQPIARSSYQRREIPTKLDQIICHNCGGRGHIAHNCTSMKKSGEKRKFQEEASTTQQEQKKKFVQFDPNFAKYPQRGLDTRTSLRATAASAGEEVADEGDEDPEHWGSEAQAAAAMFLQGEQDAEDCDRSDF